MQTKHGRQKMCRAHVEACTYRHASDTDTCTHKHKSRTRTCPHANTHVVNIYVPAHTHGQKVPHAKENAHTHINSHRMPSDTPNLSLASHIDPSARSHAHTHTSTNWSFSAEYLGLVWPESRTHFLSIWTRRWSRDDFPQELPTLVTASRDGFLGVQDSEPSEQYLCGSKGIDI